MGWLFSVLCLVIIFTGSVEAKAFQHWAVIEHVNEMTDEKSITISSGSMSEIWQVSENRVDGVLEKTSDMAMMVIHLTEDKPLLYFFYLHGL